MGASALGKRVANFCAPSAALAAMGFAFSERGAGPHQLQAREQRNGGNHGFQVCERELSGQASSPIRRPERRLRANSSNVGVLMEPKVQ